MKNYFLITLTAVFLTACGIKPFSPPSAKIPNSNADGKVFNQQLSTKITFSHNPPPNMRLFTRNDDDIAVSLNSQKPSQKALSDLKQFTAESSQAFAQDTNLQQQMKNDVKSLTFLGQFNLANQLSQALENSLPQPLSPLEYNLMNNVNNVLSAANNLATNKQTEQQNVLLSTLKTNVNSLQAAWKNIEESVTQTTFMDDFARDVADYYQSVATNPQNQANNDLQLYLNQCQRFGNLSCQTSPELTQNLTNDVSTLTAAKLFDSANQASQAITLPGSKTQVLIVPNTNVLIAQSDYFLNVNPAQESNLKNNLFASIQSLSTAFGSVYPNSYFAVSAHFSEEMINFYTFSANNPIAKMLLNVANFRTLENQGQSYFGLNLALSHDVVAMTEIGEYRCANEIAKMLREVGSNELKFSFLIPNISRVISAANDYQASNNPDQQTELKQTLKNALDDLYNAYSPNLNNNPNSPLLFLSQSMFNQYSNALKNNTPCNP